MSPSRRCLGSALATAGNAQLGTPSDEASAVSATCHRSSAETQLFLPSNVTQLAVAICDTMPGTTLLLGSLVSASRNPGLTWRFPTLLASSTILATAALPDIWAF